MLPVSGFLSVAKVAAVSPPPSPSPSLAGCEFPAAIRQECFSLYCSHRPSPSTPLASAHQYLSVNDGLVPLCQRRPSTPLLTAPEHHSVNGASTVPSTYDLTFLYFNVCTNTSRHSSHGFVHFMLIIASLATGPLRAATICMSPLYTHCLYWFAPSTDAKWRFQADTLHG